MKTRILLALLCCFALVLPALAQGIDGKWEATVQGRGGEQKMMLELKNAGGQVTGTVQTGQGQPQQIKNGKLDGTKLTFETTQQGRGGGDPVTVSWTGTLSGDVLKLSRPAGRGGGTQEIEAKRVK